MTTVLIVDTNKSSVVMTSEAFKDKVPGITVMLAANGKEALEVMSKTMPDIVVADFDLPDSDGVTLTKLMRKNFSGPILITAMPDKIATEAIKNELHCYNDSCAWLPKPVRLDVVSEKIEMFLINNRRINKRYKSNLPTNLIGKGEGRGKRAPKIAGKLANLGVGGAMFETKAVFKVKKGEEFTFTVELQGKGTTKASSTLKLRGVVQWFTKAKFGLMFVGLTDQQRKALEDYLIDAKEEKDPFTSKAQIA
jgi:CheY-like chemotaxis protein